VFRLSEAAELLGVSYDTVRRWADGGRLAVYADNAGRRVIDGAELARFCTEPAASERVPGPGGSRQAAGRQAAGRPGRKGEDRPLVGQSARNRLPGIVTNVIRDTVMAQVEIQAGPHRVVSLLSREACDELGLEPGSRAVAAVKATNVIVEIPEG
jgi:molybdopterin-binding protein